MMRNTSKAIAVSLMMLGWLMVRTDAFAQEAAAQDSTKPMAKMAEVFSRDSDTHPTLVGSVLRIGPDTVSMLINGQPREVPLADIARIETPRDSLKNGAIIGAVVLGAWCAFICGQGLDNAEQLSAVVGVNAVIGSLIGTGFDALHRGRKTLYQRPARQSAGIGFAMKWRF